MLLAIFVPQGQDAFGIFLEEPCLRRWISIDTREKTCVTYTDVNAELFFFAVVGLSMFYRILPMEDNREFTFGKFCSYVHWYYKYHFFLCSFNSELAYSDTLALYALSHLRHDRVSVIIMIMTIMMMVIITLVITEVIVVIIIVIVE